MNTNSSLFVSEQFFSIQGEGKTIGTPSYFLRLSGCNLFCGGRGVGGETWICDSIDVWKKGIKKNYEEIIKDFGGDEFLFNISNYGSHLIVTGGEPLLQQDGIVSFLSFLNKKCGEKIFVEVETNATVPISKDLLSLVSLFNCSPKLANSGEKILKRLNGDFFKIDRNELFKKFIFKFVVSSKWDVVEATKDFLIPFGIPRSIVYLMPSADNAKDLQKLSPKIVELCKDYGFKYSHRLHLSIWDKKTGV